MERGGENDSAALPGGLGEEERDGEAPGGGALSLSSSRRASNPPERKPRHYGGDLK